MGTHKVFSVAIRTKKRSMQQQPLVLVRPATEDDLHFLARLVLCASRSHMAIGFYDVMLPNASEEDILAILRQWIATPVGGYLDWSNFVIAEVDGQPAAGK